MLGNFFISPDLTSIPDRLSFIWTATRDIVLRKCLLSSTWHTAKPGPDSEPDSDPDSNPYKTRTREKPGFDTRTYLRKKPDLSPQNPDSINKKTEFKTRLIKKRSFKSVARQPVILRLYT